MNTEARSSIDTLLTTLKERLVQPGTSLLTTPAAADSPHAHRANEQLKAFLVGHNVELEYKALAPGLLGYTNGRRDWLRRGVRSPPGIAGLRFGRPSIGAQNLPPTGGFRGAALQRDRNRGNGF